MFLSYGGTPFSREWRSLSQDSTLRQVETCLKAIRERGVLHRDVMPPNMLLKCDSDQVIVLDFERATMSPDRLVLGPLSINRKREEQHALYRLKQTEHNDRLFVQEVAKARHEITCLQNIRLPANV